MKTTTMLAVNNDKNNKTRSILIIITIFLTTLLLTVISIYASGLIKYNKVNAKAIYGDYYGIYQNIKTDTLEKIKLRSEFENIGLLAYAGEVETTDNTIIRFFWGDEENFRMTNMNDKLIAGNFPVKENEIAAQSGFFKSLGYSEPKIGDKVLINYRTSAKSLYEQKEFIISGLILEVDMGIEISSYTGIVSEEFFKKNVSDDDKLYSAYFKLDNSVPLTYDNSEEVIKELASKCDILEGNVRVNSIYLMWILDPGLETIFMCSFIALIVIIFSVLVIYNIFQVGIIQKIQEYGKMKAVGATDKQVKNVVLKEGMILAVLGIPLGLIAGYLTAEITFDWLVKKFSEVTIANLSHISLFSFPMLILAALLSFITVRIALRKPMKIVANISPVEAVRYQENSIRKSSIRKGRKSMNVIGFTLANIVNNKKRIVSTIFTMGLSCVLIVVLSNVVGNIDDNYEVKYYVRNGQFEIKYDYSLNDEAYPENNLDYILENNPFNAAAIEQIKNLDGVTDVKTASILAGKLNDENTSIGIYDRESFERKKEEGAILGELDYDKLSSENGIVYSYSHFMIENGYNLNDNLTFNLIGNNENAVCDFVLYGSFGNNDQTWAITEDTYHKLNFKNATIGTIWVDCNDADYDTIKGELEKLFKSNNKVYINGYKNALKTVRLQSTMMKAGVYSFLAIIGLIGFMNMANTMIISIITRKQEFGILQAIGMTNAQLNLSLQLEGILFTFGTIIVSLVVGMPIGYAMFLYGKNNGFYGLHIYHFPIFEILIMVGIVITLQLVLSYILTRNIKKESLIERIRYQE